VAQRILIIKLGAKGDVVRTLPLLIAIKEKYPDSKITWITKSYCREILETSPHITKILTLPIDELSEKFDILFNFDVDEEATKMASKIIAEKKYGFYRENSYPVAFNFPSEYYLNTIFDDHLKKTNKKTYQEMMFDIAELPYKKQHHPIYLNEKDMEYSRDFANKNNINPKKLIGIHIGSSPRWPSKAWDQERIKEFIIKVKDKGYDIILFGGPDEVERHEKFAKELNNQGIKIFRNNPSNTDREFLSLMNLCSNIICSDSFALHISLALKKPTICLFFCTSPNEIEDYGLLKKIVSPRLNEFFPEKQDEYDKELTRSISADEVLNVIEKMKNKAIFLDRDNTLIEDKGYVHKIEDLKFLPGVLEALKKLQEEYKLIIITNQSGIARGYYSEEDYLKFRKFMHKQLKDEGIRIDAEYFCPHYLEKGIGKYKIDCNCRKPKTGMIEQAEREFNLNLADCWMIGDKDADMLLSRNAHLKGGIGIISRESSKEELEKSGAVKVFEDILQAPNYILQ
jgi:D-glycero-D-manno-heptose 1,7-bisphosphate phosphatase